MASYAIGERVSDSRFPWKTGTVVDTVGGLWNDSAVNVFWHYLGYANWERPEAIAKVTN